MQCVRTSPQVIIARQIVELARAGERNPDLLCEGALKKLRGALFED
jgi:hypothetical protein